jgi:type II secretory pathway component PulJ
MRKTRQKGFTLLEVMFAATTGMFIMLPAMEILFRAYSWYAEVQSLLTLNREAREAMDVIGNGGRRTANGNDGTPYLYGFHGRKSAPTASSLRINYKLRYQSNNLTLEGDSMASMSITCTAAATPIPDCASAGQMKTVSGWLGSDVALTTASRSIGGRTVETVVTLTDPYEAQRLKAPANASTTYRTVLTLNRDETDP